MRICDENRIKTVYCDQRRYDSSKPSYNENMSVMGLVEKSDDDDDDDDDGVMMPLVLEFSYDIGVDDMFCNDWFVYRKKII